MPTPTDDLAGLSDAEFRQRAAMALGWKWAGRCWRRADGIFAAWESTWHPDADHNDARQLVEECGRRGRMLAYTEALMRAVGVEVTESVMYTVTEVGDALLATPRDLTSAAVRVLETFHSGNKQR
jgi:hypothetical protein